MALQWLSNLVGTMQAYFRIGASGPRLKNNSGVLDIRNADDSAYASARMDDLTAEDTTLNTLDVKDNDLDLNSDAAGSGADWKYTLRVPSSGMTAAVVLTLPINDGSSGQVLETDGSGVLSWVTKAGGANQAKTDVTNLAFGDSSPVTMFTKEAGSKVKEIRVYIDTPFNGTAPTVSIGVVGTTSKYAATTEIDLKAAAGSVFVITPEDAVEGGTEALIATYSADSSSAGAARIEVDTVVPS